MIRIPPADDIAFHVALWGNKHATSYKLQMPIEFFDFQCMRADQNLFDVIPAGSTTFLSLQKAIDLFAALRKWLFP
jgi:hypothetical protein